jgi:hypothetical protein
MSWSKTEFDNACTSFDGTTEEQNQIADMISADVADILSQISTASKGRVPQIRLKTLRDVQHTVTACAMALRGLLQ